MRSYNTGNGSILRILRNYVTEAYYKKLIWILNPYVNRPSDFNLTNEQKRFE